MSGIGMTLSKGQSCFICQQRKVRCDQQKPCANCVKAQVECRVVPPQPPKRRKKMKKLQERDLIERLKKYEALMSQHGLNFDSILDDRDDFADLVQDLGGLNTSPPGRTEEVYSRQEGKLSKWFEYYKEHRNAQDLPHDSSDEEDLRPTVHHAFDATLNNTDGFPLVVGGLPACITSLHPSAIHIFRLWQVYIDNVNPLLKISHVPTLQGRIIGAAADPIEIPKSLEALMFAIYFIAVQSMTDEDVQSTFGEDKPVLLARYHKATQQALTNASFMRSNELMVLQAYLLYLFGVGQYVDPRDLFCLVGIAVRIAMRLGLHRDSAQFSLPPFDTEQRRRLWWQILGLDKRIAEITGSDITALPASKADCRRPLNVNDTDLHPHAKQPPSSHVGATEMLFCLTRVELTIAFAAVPGGIKPKKRAKCSPSPSSPDILAPTASQNLPSDLDDYFAYMESAYLRHCDPKIPIQLFTLLTTRIALCKLRLIDFMCRGVPTTNLDNRERDGLFDAAIQMLEHDNVVCSTDNLRGFLWHNQLQLPMPVYSFLVSELRHYTTGELCERAWKALCDNHSSRIMICNLRSPMHVALGHMLVKAWDAHEDVELQLGRVVQTPRLVTSHRERLPRNTSQQTAPDPAGGKGAIAGPRDAIGQTSGMMFDENMVFPSIDSTNQIYGAGLPDYDEMELTYLMQNGALEGFGGSTRHTFA